MDKGTPVILYEDHDLLVLDKPAGLSAESGHAAHPSAEQWAFQYLQQQHRRVYVRAAHRLDRPTRGILVLAKNKFTLTALMHQFEQRTVQKRYRAALEGRLAAGSGTLKHWLRRDETGRKALVSDEANAQSQYAELEYSTIALHTTSTTVDITLHTGRFHQIRAQFSHIGHPVTGDVLYGGAPWRDNAIQLAAVFLALEHPVTGVPVSFTLPDFTIW